ncbi:MAG: methyltransferase domain-containing protein [Burkholderiales bacterium]
MPAIRGRLFVLFLALVAGACASGARQPDVHYEPTPPAVVESMMRLAAIRPGDVAYDLGCGDGRVVIAALKAGAARGVCVDIDPQRIRESRANAAAAGVEARIRFLEQDLFTTDFSDATVVFLFLWPDLNLKLRPQLFGQLAPGSRVVSYVHDMGDWSPGMTLKVKGFYGERNLYLWHMPPRMRQ